ncbi:MAG: WD40 repeat domain-containing serine/threonine-protein kinase [Planctomycetaceae bacterium]
MLIHSLNEPIESAMQDDNQNDIPADRESRFNRLLEEWEQRFLNTGEDLSPEQLSPQGPRELWEALRNDIESLKQFGVQFIDLPNSARAEAEPLSFVSDQYASVELVGEGGQGHVLRARDKSLDREVAVKLLKARWRWNASAQSRLEQEARITGKLEHPGVIPLYGFGYDKSGQPFYAMRYLRDERTFDRAIGQLLEMTHESERAIAFRNLLGQFSTICRTIDYAHFRGVVHRDIKPDNIMTGNFGEVFVADWGLAKMISEDELPADSEELPTDAGVTFSHASGIAGTLGYMSPEQASGGSRVGVESDVFSLGATLYHLLTGQAPFHGDSVSELLRQVQAGQFVNPRVIRPETPRALEAICLKAMSGSPGNRYATAGAIADEIERWLADEPVHAWPEPIAEQVRRWVKRRRVLVTSTFATLLVASVLLTIGAIRLDLARRAELSAKVDLAKANAGLAEQNVRLRRPQYASQIRLIESLYDLGELNDADRVLLSTDEDLRGYEWSFWKNACQQPRLLSVRARNDSLDQLGQPALTLGAISPDGSRIAAVVRNVSLMQNGYAWAIRVVDVPSRSVLWEHKTKNLVRSVSFLPDGGRLLVEAEVHPAESTISLGDALRDLHRGQKVASDEPKEASERFSPEEQPPSVELVFLVLQSADGTVLETIDQNKMASFMAEISGTSSSLDGLNLPKIAVIMAQQSSPDEASNTPEPVSFSIEEQDLGEQESDTIREQTGASRRNVQFMVKRGDSTEPVGSVMLRLPVDVRITAAALNATRTLAATALSDGSVRVWRVPDGAPFALFNSNSSEVQQLAFDAKVNAMLLWLGKSLLGDANEFFTAELPNPATIDAMPEGWPMSFDEVARVAKSANGNVIVFVTVDRSLQVWDLKGDRMLLQEALPISDGTTEYEVALQENGSRVAIVSRSVPESQTELTVIDVANRKPLWSSNAFGAPMCFAGDELIVRRIASQSMLRLDAQTGEVRGELPPWEADSPAVDISRLAYNQSQNVLVGFPKVIDHWMRRRRESDLVYSLSLGSRKITRVRSPSPGTARPVSLVRFSRDGTRAIVAYEEDSRVEIWDAQKWRIQAILDDHQGEITDLAFSHQETRVATASRDGSIKIWDVQTGSLFATVLNTNGESNGIWFVGFGKDDLEIIAGSSQGICRWNGKQRDPELN